MSVDDSGQHMFDDNSTSEAALPPEEEVSHATAVDNVPGDEASHPHDAQAAEQTIDNLEQTEGLLGDVPAPVVVELGRLRMTTAQVIRLKQGQVLRLPRAPADPVDLVVNGKIFGKGELVEIDGELGIRLLSLTGER